MIRRRAWTSLPLWLAATAVAGSAGAVEQPSARIHRVPEGVAPPTIDGNLDDPVWETAVPIGPLTQVVPVEGGQPSERTEVRITYDAHAFYLAVRAYDSEPDEIIAPAMRRDASLTAGDRITFLIDTFHDHRNAYLFSTNPNGARFDGILENNTVFRTPWDGIWNAKAQVDDQGWTCEFEIPFKTISFDPNIDTWGFNLLRNVRRRNEENRWSSWTQNKFLTDVSEVGHLEGLEGLEQGVGLDVVVSGVARTFHDRLQPSGDANGHTERSYDQLDPALDAFYKLTPSTTASLTVNTDFSDADVDARQVNLDRFALFFPETRDFFLQDAGIFDFAHFRTTGFEPPNNNGLPFFSRRIGISEEGEEIDLLAGFKVTGREGPFNFGMLNAQMADHDDVGPRNLSVVRGKWNVGEESTVGFIATHGDPSSDRSNTVAGVDTRLRTSRIAGDQVLQLDAFGEKSHTPSLRGNQWAGGALLSYPNDRWRGSLGVVHVGESFNPTLGFVNRPDTLDYTADLRRRWRPVDSWIRSVDVSFDSRFVTTTDGSLETMIFTPTLFQINDQLDDFVAPFVELRTERLVEDFEIASDALIPVGRYDWARPGIRIGTATSRPLSLRLTYSEGRFYTGSLRSLDVTLEWRPGKHLFSSLRYLQNQGRLDETCVDDATGAVLPDTACGVPGTTRFSGDFTQRLVQWRVNVVFSPDLSWDTFLQWDQDSQDLGWNSRLRWIVEPGQEVVLVWNQGILTRDFELDRSIFEPTSTELTAKVVWTFRF
ncbi:MAG: carbohydrate binding family 9 domain-containing protein [Myxococcota bacterium]